MSLIEELGGYDNSKGVLEAYKKNGWSISDVCKGFHQYFTIEDLEKAVHQYRQENNIFDIGDKVVSKEDHDLVKTVILISNGLARLKCLQFDHVYPLFNFRHATNEEIKAGHRL